MFRCNKCRIEKPLSEFYKDRAYKRGHQSFCKDCNKAYKAWWKSTERGKRLRKENCRKLRTGCTVQLWNAAWKVQDGLCGICQAPLHSLSRTPHADHCHTTKKVRGILCNNCNQAIGYFKDDPVRCIAAAEYLRNPPLLFTEFL